jgi:hypothetical protein
MNTPMEIPMIAALIEFTFPKYSGARKRELAPNVFMKLPPTAPKRMNQKMSNTWYFLKCRNTN